MRGPSRGRAWRGLDRRSKQARSSAPMHVVSVYEGMLDEIALLRDIRIAEEQIAGGEGKLLYVGFRRTAELLLQENRSAVR